CFIEQRLKFRSPLLSGDSILVGCDVVSLRSSTARLRRKSACHERPGHEEDRHPSVPEGTRDARPLPRSYPTCYSEVVLFATPMFARLASLRSGLHPVS